MIGTDIIEIARVERAAGKKNFLERVFTEGERRHYADKGCKAQTLAGMFCAKEAVVKALGCGFGAVNITDIEVTHNGQGKPGVVLHNLAFEHAKGRTAHISISHCKDYATAVCILV